MPLIEAPVLCLGDPQPIAFPQREVQRADRAGLDRGKGDRREHVLLGEQHAGLARFGLALFGEVDVPPAGETVLQVPLALAVAD